MVTGELLKELTRLLTPLEAREILSAAAGIDREMLFCKMQDPLSEEEASRARAMLERRLAGEPLQYILGEWDFYSRTFKVEKGVLIPREDTEVLVDEALALVDKFGAGSLLDLCTGSGCVAVTLALERPAMQVTAADISENALSLARTNAALLGAVNCRVIYADVLSDPPEELWGCFDLVTANPPYIKSGDIPHLQREVTFEPSLALDGGEDGLIFYRAIASRWKKVLKKGGSLALEIGIGQGRDVFEILAQNGFSSLSAVRDTAGIDRVIVGTLNV